MESLKIVLSCRGKQKNSIKCIHFSCRDEQYRLIQLSRCTAAIGYRFLESKLLVSLTVMKDIAILSFNCAIKKNWCFSTKKIIKNRKLNNPKWRGVKKMSFFTMHSDFNFVDSIEIITLYRNRQYKKIIISRWPIFCVSDIKQIYTIHFWSLCGFHSDAVDHLVCWINF